MKNIKIEKNLIGDKFWPAVSFVDVSGQPNTKKYPEGLSTQETEKVIQTWENVAVLEVTPNIPFKFGYIHGNSIHYLTEVIETKDSKFAVRIGDDNVRFFVLPNSLDRNISLKVLEITKEVNENYRDLPLY